MHLQLLLYAKWSSVTPWLMSGVQEGFHSNGIEWSGVVSGHSMKLHGVPKGMSLSLVKHNHIPFGKR
jgi:hypothetical protein